METTNLSANISETKLVVVAPKIKREATLEEAKNKKIEIKVEKHKTAS